MRSAAFYIHTSLPDNPVFLPVLHEFQTMVDIRNLNFVKPLHVDAVIFVLVDEHFLINFLLVVLEQVHHVFVVELEKGTVDFDEFPALGDERVENIVDGPWDNASMIFVLLQAPEEGGLLRFVSGVGPEDVVPVAAEHGVGFAAARLAVGEHCYIISLRALGQEGFDILEYLSLSALSSEYSLQLLFALARRHFDLDGFLCKLVGTLSMQVMDYLSSFSDSSSGRSRTMVVMLTEIYFCLFSL